MNGPILILAACLGLVVGPFVRRLVDQVPGRHPLFDASGAGVPFRTADLVPVRSWFDEQPAGSSLLAGSPDDRADGVVAATVTRWRAPVIDIGCAVVMVALAHRVGWTAALPSFLVFGAALVTVTVIDIDHFRIPDRIVFPTLGATVVLLSGAAVLGDVQRGLLAAGVGALAFFAFLFVFFFIFPKGMGFGDVKLALVLGLHLGWAGSVATVDGTLVERGITAGIQLVLMGALVGSLLGTVIGVGVLIASKRNAAFPFGPALCLGAVVAIVFSESFVR